MHIQAEVKTQNHSKPAASSKKKIVRLQTIHDAAYRRRQRPKPVTNGAADVSKHAVARSMASIAARLEGRGQLLDVRREEEGREQQHAHLQRRHLYFARRLCVMDVSLEQGSADLCVYIE